MPDRTHPDPYRRLRAASGRWRIPALRDTIVQFFPDTTPEERAAIRFGCSVRGRVATLNDPIGLSAHGKVYDGAQRLAVAAEMGAEWLSPESVTIAPNVTADNVEETALRANLNRRHGAAEMGLALRRYMAFTGYSQGRVADEIGRSQQIISYWLRMARVRYPEDGSSPAEADQADLDVAFEPEVVMGLDGRPQNVGRRRRAASADEPAPWERRGSAIRQVDRLTSAARSLAHTLSTDRPDGLDQHGTEVALGSLEDLADALGNLQRETADALRLLHERAAAAAEAVDAEDEDEGGDVGTLDVTCPHCHAAPGRSCVTTGGAYTSHAARSHLAHAAWLATQEPAAADDVDDATADVLAAQDARAARRLAAFAHTTHAEALDTVRSARGEADS